MTERDTPILLVKKWGKKWPWLYEGLKSVLNAKEDGVLEYPDYCKLPIGGTVTYLVHKGVNRIEAARIGAEITACWLWRRNKVIYAFDRDLAMSLAEQVEELDDTSVIPADILMHPPYPCTYIKTSIVEGADGFFFWIEYDLDTEKTELRVQWLLDNMEETIPSIMHIIPGATLAECWEDTIAQSDTNIANSFPNISVESELLHDDAYGGELFKLALIALQLILYLLADNAEIDAPAKPAPSKRSKKTKSKKPNSSIVKSFNVGVRIGAAFRKARQQYALDPDAQKPVSMSGKGSVKRPHTRRGHWHHYWKGPREGEREIILRWVAPMVIHPDGNTDDSIVIIPVN